MMMSVFSAGTAYRSLPKAATSNNASHPNQAKEISRQQLNLNILQKGAIGNFAKFGHAPKFAALQLSINRRVTHGQ